jgi:hypothetical protein
MADPALKMVEGQQGKTQNAKRTKFVQLAEKRTVNAIKAIRVIGKLGNRSAYEYEDDDVKKIVKALLDEVEALKARMRSTKRADGVDFKL